MEGLRQLAMEVLGETPVRVGESFNVHYESASAFMKVTRPWVKPDRARTDLAAAKAMHESGIAVARPLVDEVLTFVDDEDRTRYVTVWERLKLGPVLSLEARLDFTANMIVTLSRLTPPSALRSCFQLSDFVHAVHVRLDGSPHPYATRVIEEVTGLSELHPYTHPVCAGLIHGDLHPYNVFSTPENIRTIDWESACCGPVEWDVAQNMRYTPDELRASREQWWTKKNVDMDLVHFYRRVRTLSSLSHLMATNQYVPLYYEGLHFLGWEAR